MFPVQQIVSSKKKFEKKEKEKKNRNQFKVKGEVKT